MGLFSKPLNTALAASKPDHNQKLARECYTLAKKQEDAAKLLHTAGKAFENNDSSGALELLQHAQDRLDKKD